MLFSGINTFISNLQADPAGTILEYAFLGICILLSLILHECAHGYVALKCGDPTAKMLGRLTLDPRKHLDPVGTLCMIFLRVGWAKPVPINPRNFRHYRRDYILVSFAGIAVNFLLFLIGLAAYVLLAKHIHSYSDVWYYAIQFTVMLAQINIGLAIFNLIPVPPLDGYRILNQFAFGGRLDQSMNPQTMMIIRYAFLALCITGVLSPALSKVIGSIFNFFLNLFVKIL